MIKVYCIEDLTIEMLDTMVERGEVFNVTSKSTLLSKSSNNGERDAFWRDGDKHTEPVRNTGERKEDCEN